MRLADTALAAGGFGPLPVPAPVATDGHRLSPAHRAHLSASGISDTVLEARQYWTATPTDAAELRELGHSAALVAAADALMLPLWDVHGNLAYTVIRPDRPNYDAKGRAKKYQLPRGAKTTLDVHPLARAALRDATIPLWVTEGQKKADAALSHGAGAVIALTGVWCWKGNALSAWDAVVLKDRVVYLAFDSDATSNPKVLHALRRLRAQLIGLKAAVRVVHLESGPRGDKVGLDDALADGATLDDLVASATDDVRVHRPAADDRRPELDVTILHRPVIAEAFGRLARAGVYRAAEGLAVLARHDGVPALELLTSPAALRPILDRHIRCVRRTPDGAVPVFPPRDLAELMVHELEPPVPRLVGIVTSPTFTAEGRYLDTPGYDVDSGLIVHLGDFMPRPAPIEPTVEDVAEARRLWDVEALGDFPLQSDADRTATLALALTPLIRPMIRGECPLLIADAATPGSGKGKLVTTCLLPTLGRFGWRTTAWPKTEDEVRKRLLSLLRTQPQAILFDNVSGRISSSSLSLVLTSPVWDERILGVSEGARVLNRCTWVMTSNNAQLSDELAQRRAVPIRLVPEMDHPELRQGFRHPALESWVLEHRADLLWALVVFVRHWLAQGRPAGSVAALGSFESWTATVGGILEAAGYTDFLGNRASWNEASDPDTARWEEFVAAWESQHGSTLMPAKDLLPLAEAHEIFANGITEDGRAKSLGSALGHRRDRFFGAYQIKQGSGRNRRLWYLRCPMAEEPLSETSVASVASVASVTSSLSGPYKSPADTAMVPVASRSDGIAPMAQMSQPYSRDPATLPVVREAPLGPNGIPLCKVHKCTQRQRFDGQWRCPDCAPDSWWARLARSGQPSQDAEPDPWEAA